jgi:hypothetical protein
MMQPHALTQAFQTALGMLITNDSVARGLIAGHLAVERIHPDLKEPDVQALRALLQANARRLQAISMLATQRRKRRILGLLPASANLLKLRIGKYWRTYLAAVATRGAPPAFEDAAAFAASLLADVGDSPAAPFVRFELRCCEIGSLLTSNSSGGAPEPIGATIGHLRLSRFVRIERFDFTIDEAMHEFRTAGVMRTEWPHAPTHLVFHPLRAQPPVIMTTRLPAALAAALQITRNSGGIDTQALQEAAPPELRPGIQQMITRLVAMRVLEADRQVV